MSNNASRFHSHRNVAKGYYVLVLCSFYTVVAASLLQAQQTSVSTAVDTKKTSLSVYNSGFGIVRQQRSLQLQEGLSVLRFEDVAARIDPTSISIKSISHPDALSVREQNYQYDLLNPASILNKSIDKSVKLRRVLPNGQTEIVEGTLLHAPNLSPPGNVDYDALQSGQGTGLVIRTRDNKIVLNPLGEIVLDEVPAGLVTKPSLLWKLRNTQRNTQTAEVAYMTEGLTWAADYVCVLNESDSKLDLNAWVTLTNQSGTSYHDAELQLIAGTVRRAAEEKSEYILAKAVSRGSRVSETSFQEESFFEYHLYSLDGTTTLANNEIKQMQLLSSNDVSVTKKLVFDVDRYHSYASTPGNGSSTEEVKAAVIVELKNSKQNNMGMPLPKGKVRMYKADRQGRLQFVGEDAIDHTANDEKVRLYIGDAFDVVGTKIQKEVKQVSKRANEVSYEVTLRNHKENSVEVSIMEHAYGDWEVVSSSLKSAKIDASTAEFVTTLAKDESKTISYTIRTKW